MSRSRGLRWIIPAAVVAAIIGLAAYTILLLDWTDVEYRSKSIVVDGTTREYLLVIPRSVGAEPVPLVVALHGTGDSPQSMASYSGLDRLASEMGFLLVYPSAIRSRWKVEDVETADMNRDIRFMDALIERLSLQFNLDSRRIYAVGMSNGASFAQLWGAHRSHQIAAVVAHSGESPMGAPIPERAFPVMLLVGSKDSQAPVETMRQTAANYRRDHHPVELSIVNDLGHEWAKSKNPQIWEFLSQHCRE
jgi:polyhydroxybutyrate depolymerase